MGQGSRSGCTLLWWVLLMGVFVSRASAQSEAPLALAEQHFQRVEFDAARDAAHAALRSGQLQPAELGRAYEILGVSAAAVGNHEEARAAYLRLLALRPDARPSEILPPEKNRVFYDAQGFWYARPERFSLALAATQRDVQVTVHDPLGMAHTLRYGEQARPDEQEERELSPATQVFTLSFAGSEPLGLVFVLHDRDGNVLARRELTLEGPGQSEPCCGMVAAPLPKVQDPSPAPRNEPPPADKPRSRWRSPWLWGAVSVVVVGAAATTTALLMRDRNTEVRTDVSLLSH